MFRKLFLGLSFLSMVACQRSTLSDSATWQASAANSNLQLNTNDQFSFNYQFIGTAGTYDIIVTTSHSSSTTYPTYSSLDLATIQGTFVTYNRLKLKPLYGIFIPGREGQPAKVLANSVIPLNGILCSVMAIDVDLTNESRVDVEFNSLVTANDIVNVSAIPHQENINPCDNSILSSGTETGLPTNGMATVSFSRDVLPEIMTNCTRCHSAFNSYQGVRSTVWAKDISKSGLYQALLGKMSDYAPAGLADTVNIWINEGALNN